MFLDTVKHINTEVFCFGDELVTVSELTVVTHLFEWSHALSLLSLFIHKTLSYITNPLFLLNSLKMGSQHTTGWGFVENNRKRVHIESQVEVPGRKKPCFI